MVAEPDGLSLVLESHMVEAEKRLLRVVYKHAHTWTYMYAHTLKNKLIKNDSIYRKKWTVAQEVCVTGNSAFPREKP